MIPDVDSKGGSRPFYLCVWREGVVSSDLKAAFCMGAARAREMVP